MPIEHINKTDTLNEGRVKLNAAIDGANAADVTSQAADTKATQALANSESTQTQLDTIVIDGDSSVEAAQARVDEKGDSHPTLKARIDDGMNSVNQQLAQIATNIMNVEGSDDVERIINGSKDNTTLLFPKGTYVIDSHVLINNKKKLKWVAVGEVILYDSGKEVELSNATIGKTANGVTFRDCDIEFEGNFISSVNVASGKVDDNFTDEIVPAIDFIECENVVFGMGISGRGLPWGTDYIHDENIEERQVMNDYRVRFFRCENVHAYGRLLNDIGVGEYYGFYKVENLTFENIRYNQKDSPVTFWSIAKVIDCVNAKVRGFRVQSESSGSFIDISGQNIIYEDIILDYPNGKLIDVTQEWGYLNVQSGDITIKDCKSTGGNLVIVETGDGTNLKSINKLTIDNVEVVGDNKESSNVFVTNGLVRELIVRNVNILNPGYLNSMIESLNEHQTARFENINLVCDENSNRTRVLIETRGLTEIKDSYINSKYIEGGSGINNLTLRDRDYYTGNLKNSNNLIVFKNVIFEECHIIFESNTVFKGCTFINTTFANSAIGESLNASVYIEGNTQIHWDEVEMGSSRHLFNFSSVSKLKDFHLENVRITGVVNNRLVFNEIHNKVENIVFNNVDTEGLVRFERGSNQFFLTGITYNSELFSKRIIVKNSNIYGVLFRFDGESDGGEKVDYFISDNYFYCADNEGIPFSPIAFQQSTTSLNRINFSFIQNALNGTMSTINSNRELFNIFNENFNAENILR